MVSASCPSTILTGPGTIGHRVFSLFEDVLTQFNYKAEISHVIQKCNRPLNRAWSMHVYTEIGETLL